MLVAGDVYRPAAIDQLSILGEQVYSYTNFMWFFKKNPFYVFRPFSMLHKFIFFHFWIIF